MRTALVIVHPYQSRSAEDYFRQKQTTDFIVSFVLLFPVEKYTESQLWGLQQTPIVN